MRRTNQVTVDIEKPLDKVSNRSGEKHRFLDKDIKQTIHVRVSKIKRSE